MSSVQSVMGGGLTLTNWLSYGPIYCGAGSEPSDTAGRAAGQDVATCSERVGLRAKLLRCGVCFGP